MTAHRITRRRMLQGTGAALLGVGLLGTAATQASADATALDPSRAAALTCPKSVSTSSWQGNRSARAIPDRSRRGRPRARLPPNRVRTFRWALSLSVN